MPARGRTDRLRRHRSPPADAFERFAKGTAMGPRLAWHVFHKQSEPTDDRAVRLGMLAIIGEEYGRSGVEHRVVGVMRHAFSIFLDVMSTCDADEPSGFGQALPDLGCQIAIPSCRTLRRKKLSSFSRRAGNATGWIFHPLSKNRSEPICDSFVASPGETVPFTNTATSQSESRRGFPRARDLLEAARQSLLGAALEFADRSQILAHPLFIARRQSGRCPG